MQILGVDHRGVIFEADWVRGWRMGQPKVNRRMQKMDFILDRPGFNPCDSLYCKIRPTKAKYLESGCRSGTVSLQLSHASEISAYS